MSTTYQLGSATIIKDLIFGWVISIDGNTYLLSECDSQSLEELARAQLPAWLGEFQASCKEYLAVALVEEKAAKEKQEASLLLLQTQMKELEEATERRQAEVYSIKETISTGLQHGDTVSMGEGAECVYARVVKSVEGDSVRYTVLDRKSRVKYSGQSLDEAAEVIAKSWW